MAFYTGQATIQTYLPRTPDVYLAGMNVNASSLLNNTWSTWRGTAGSSSSLGVKDTQHSHQTQTPLTPPMTSTFQSRTTSGGGSSYASNQHQHDVPESTSDRSTTTMTLPPIAHLERHIHNLPPRKFSFPLLRQQFDYYPLTPPFHLSICHYGRWP